MAASPAVVRSAHIHRERTPVACLPVLLGDLVTADATELDALPSQEGHHHGGLRCRVATMLVP
jgi:hypothetical protein